MTHFEKFDEITFKLDLEVSQDFTKIKKFFLFQKTLMKSKKAMQSKLQLKMQLKLGLDMELSKQIPRPTRRLFIVKMPQLTRFLGRFKNTPLLKLALRTKFNMQLSIYQRTA